MNLLLCKLQHFLCVLLKLKKHGLICFCIDWLNKVNIIHIIIVCFIYRKARSELRQEFDDCNYQLKEAQNEIEALEKEKLDTLKNHEVELANKQDELDVAKSELELHDVCKMLSMWVV